MKCNERCKDTVASIFRIPSFMYGDCSSVMYAYASRQPSGIHANCRLLHGCTQDVLYGTISQACRLCHRCSWKLIYEWLNKYILITWYY